MIITALSVCMGIYIMLESINEMSLMDNGDRACRVAKYVISAVSGLMMVYYGILQQIDWLHLALGAGAALFMWPHMVERGAGLIYPERRGIDRRARKEL